MTEYDSRPIGDTGWFVYNRATPPFRVEAFKSGLACVLDINGLNLVHGARGQVLTTPEGAAVLVALLNG